MTTESASARMRYVGLDVHAETITAAVAEMDGAVHDLGTIANAPAALRKLMRKLGPIGALRVCYEAGPTGYVVYWQLVALGVACEVIAPSLIPTKAGDRVKTDRRDAVKLARCYRAGELTPVFVPDRATEGLRDVVRAREAAKQDLLRARHRLGKLLLRHGRQRPAGMRAWSVRHEQWLGTQRFALETVQLVYDEYRAALSVLVARVARLEEAMRTGVATLRPEQQAVVTGLTALRGVRDVTAITVVSELTTLTRFAGARSLMAYAGLVPREHSSGRSQWRGAITKTGNAHVRRVLVEAAWGYRHRPVTTARLRQRQQGQPAVVLAVAERAQHRLCARYRALATRGKAPLFIATTIARELLGYVWAIGQVLEHPRAPAEEHVA